MPIPLFDFYTVFWTEIAYIGKIPHLPNCRYFQSNVITSVASGAFSGLASIQTLLAYAWNGNSLFLVLLILLLINLSKGKSAKHNYLIQLPSLKKS